MSEDNPQVTHSPVKPDGHMVSATFNEVPKKKMDALIEAAKQPDGPEIEVLSPNQVTIKCHSSDEAEVRRFMSEKP